MNDFRVQDSLAEQISRHIGKLIVCGELKAGDRIQEMRIASELNVSRGSVREAYLILERRYLIEIQPRKGAVVAHMTPSHVRNLHELNTALQVLLVKKAVNAWQGNDLDPFIDLVKDMEDCIASGEIGRFHQASFDFVTMARRLCDNDYLNEMLDNFQPAIHRTFYLLLNKSDTEMAVSLETFRTLVDAAQRRDVAAAVEAIERRGEYLCEAVISHLS